MLLYRVFNRLSTAAPGDAGHPSYIHRPQTHGRWDNPGLYASWYLSTSPEGAIAETFGNLEFWAKPMFTRAYLPGGRMTLGVFEVPDNTGILDLDDSNNLLHLGMKPSQVVIRNLPYTQARAAAAFAENRWAGLGWWSFHRPFWSNRMLWSTAAAPAPLTFVDGERLDLSHRAVESVRATLSMPVK
jgi:hypothetical protein